MISDNKKRPVKIQIRNIFCLAGIIPIIILGAFSVFTVYKQMNDHYTSLTKADGINADSVLFDITTMIYTSTEPYSRNTSCQKIFAEKTSLSDAQHSSLAAINSSIDSYRSNTAAISTIRIYTDNPNIPNMSHISYVPNYSSYEWYEKIGTSWQTWTCMKNHDLLGNEYKDLCLIKRIGVASADYSAYLVIRLDNNYIKNRIQRTDNVIDICVDDLPIIYSSDNHSLDTTMEVPENYKSGFFKYTGPLYIENHRYLSDFISFRPYGTDNFFLIRTINKTAYNIIYQIIFIYLLIILLSIAVPLLLIIRFSDYFSGRVTTLKTAMHKARTGDYNIIDSFKGDDELTETFDDLKATVNIIREKEAQYYQTKISEQELVNRQQQMEYEMLAAQINPHFLYNTLETIRMQALAGGNRDVSQSIKLLGKSMHYVLENTGTSSTTLASELDYIQTYLEIQKLRFGDRVNAEFVIDDDIDPDRCMILPLLLQPIVENAITHGLENTEDRGLVTITISSEYSKDDPENKNDMKISIKDNGTGIDLETLKALNAKIGTENPVGHTSHPADEAGFTGSDITSSRRSIGLCNIGRRIRLFYGSDYYMKIESKEHVGTEVTLLLPKTFGSTSPS